MTKPKASFSQPTQRLLLVAVPSQGQAVRFRDWTVRGDSRDGGVRQELAAGAGCLRRDTNCSWRKRVPDHGLDYYVARGPQSRIQQCRACRPRERAQENRRLGRSFKDAARGAFAAPRLGLWKRRAQKVGPLSRQ